MFFQCYTGLLHASTELLRQFRSIASSNRFDSLVSEVSSFTLSNHCLGRCFIGFPIRTYEIFSSSPNTASPLRSFRSQEQSDIWLVFYGLSRSSFSAIHIPYFDFKQICEFSVKLSSRRLIVSVRLLAIRTMFTRVHYYPSQIGCINWESFSWRNKLCLHYLFLTGSHYACYFLSFFPSI